MTVNPTDKQNSPSHSGLHNASIAHESKNDPPIVFPQDGEDGLIFPGPQGVAGADSTVAGPAGVPFSASDGEDGLVFPGAQGAAGAASTVPGPAGAPFSSSDGEDGLVFPGSQGPAGAASVVAGPPGADGATGAAGVPWLSSDGEDGMFIPGAGTASTDPGRHFSFFMGG